MAERVAHQDDVAGLGGDVGAGAAEGQADVGPGQGRGVVDAVADHATRAGVCALLPASAMNSAFCCRQQLGVDLGDAQVARPPPGPPRRGRRSAARCRLDAQARSSSSTPRASGRTRSRAPITPRTMPSRATSSAVWPAGVEPLEQRRAASGGSAMPCSSSSRARADDERCPPAVRAVTPAPGWAWKSLDRLERRAALRGLLQDQPGQRVFAPLLRAWRRGAAARPARCRPAATTSPSSSRPSVSVPVLSKAKASTRPAARAPRRP